MNVVDEGMLVNPSGIQMDAINTTAAGERYESDFVWTSAGRRTADGYVVEIALPLETIRFSGGGAVTIPGCVPQEQVGR